MAYYAPDESCSSNWTNQNIINYSSSSGYTWDSQDGTEAAYQSFEGGPVSPQSTMYPPEWGYHATTHVVADDYQAHNYRNLQQAPVEQGAGIIGGDASAISRIEPGLMSPSIEHHYSGPGDHPCVYQTHNLSQAHQVFHSANVHEQEMYMLNSGLLPAQSEGDMATDDPCLTAISSASPQSPSHPNRQYTSPRISGDAEHSVPCPYGCGTILTGVHAVGNLTRHIKSQSCTAPGKAKAKYICLINGCNREYTRSDGLRVHMRRRHNAPAALPKNSPVAENDDED